MLSLRENKIRSLPSGIGQLQQLVTFDASNNHLSQLPEALGNCVNLSALDVQHNELVDIPESIGNLKNLTRLGLRYKYLYQEYKYNRKIDVQCFQVKNMVLSTRALQRLL